MNASFEKKTQISHDEIANLAQQIWQTEGCQSGRDLEYWLKAERQIPAASQPGKQPAKNAGPKLNTPAATGKKTVRQPAAPVGSSVSDLRNRAAGIL
jgi:hypothetical protein